MCTHGCGHSSKRKAQLKITKKKTLHRLRCCHSLAEWCAAVQTACGALRRGRNREHARATMVAAYMKTLLPVRTLCRRIGGVDVGDGPRPHGTSGPRVWMRTMPSSKRRGRCCPCQLLPSCAGRPKTQQLRSEPVSTAGTNKQPHTPPRAQTLRLDHNCPNSKPSPQSAGRGDAGAGVHGGTRRMQQHTSLPQYNNPENCCRRATTAQRATRRCDETTDRTTKEHPNARIAAFTRTGDRVLAILQLLIPATPYSSGIQ
jgi:hypothetical protein